MKLRFVLSHGLRLLTSFISVMITKLITNGDFNTVEFLDDFCEGETDVKNIKIVPLDKILDYYVETKLANDFQNQ